MDFKPTYKPFGKQAILIEWKPIIDEEILNTILLFKEKISREKSNLFSDVIIGYNSLTLKYKVEFADFSEEVEALKAIYKSDFKLSKIESSIWEIPVCYDLEFGVDLKEIAVKTKIAIPEIIQLHSEKLYTVFFIGFLPGFLYLGGLNPRLFFDRKSSPRLKVAKGAVAIGGKQTGIYPSESAGGWNIIGKTPINFFNIKNENPCFAKAGDKIKFIPISVEEFYQLEKEVAHNRYTISKTLAHD